MNDMCDAARAACLAEDTTGTHTHCSRDHSSRQDQLRVRHRGVR